MRQNGRINILLLGGGGREHAMAKSLAASPRTANLYIVPGNAGTALCGTNVDLPVANFGAVKQFVIHHNINLVVVGPEEPLVKGIADFFADDPDLKFIGLAGPSEAGARLEGSKDFAKAFMTRHAIPTATHRSFSKNNVDEGFEYLERLRPPYVLKADGLAAGKGVVITGNLDDAKRELSEMLAGKFGSAGNRVVIEEYLDGIECSVFAATDGKNYKILPVAKDYKRVGEGDTGPNTGGMGAISPVPFADAEFMAKVEERIVKPTVEGLAKEGITYRGFLFIGLMNVGGDPYVIEYNVRMGDPETQVVFPRITSDIVGLFEGIVNGTLDSYRLTVTPRWAAAVVCVSGGYPGEYGKGFPISGLDEAEECGAMVFHAGTAVESGETLTAGGRVLAVGSLGDTMREAVDNCYRAIEGGISFERMYFRRDIGGDL